MAEPLVAMFPDSIAEPNANASETKISFVWWFESMLFFTCGTLPLPAYDTKLIRRRSALDVVNQQCHFEP